MMQLAKELENACTSGVKEEIEKAHQEMVNAVESMGILKMAAFDRRNTNNPMFKVFHQYMAMVLKMLIFIRAVRTANWQLHLQALEKFAKHFFTHDRQN